MNLGLTVPLGDGHYEAVPGHMVYVKGPLRAIPTQLERVKLKMEYDDAQTQFDAFCVMPTAENWLKLSPAERQDIISKAKDSNKISASEKAYLDLFCLEPRSQNGVVGKIISILQRVELYNENSLAAVRNETAVNAKNAIE